MPGLPVAGAVVRIENGTRECLTTDTDGRYRFLNVTGEVAVAVAAGRSSALRTVEVAMNTDRTVDFALEHEGTPPFQGTVFISPNILTPSDPTSLQAVEYTGRGGRTIYDYRVNEWITVEAYLFKAQYSSGELEFQVNPEFGSVAAARAQVDVYAPALGRLPAAMLSRALKVHINAGNELFGGNAYDRSFLIHTERGEEYLREGFLEEVLFHEIGHISLDLDHAGSPGWLAAQGADEVFISDYARDNPGREDIAESILVYFAVRYRPERLSTEDLSTSVFTIPNRLAYFDAQQFDMSSYRVQEISGDGVISVSCHETIDIRKDFSIEGVMLGPDGEPLEGIGLWAWKGEVSNSGSGTTGADGTFHIRVPDGSFTLDVYADFDAGCTFVGRYGPDGFTTVRREATLIKVDGADVTDIVIRLPAPPDELPRIEWCS